MQKINGTLLPKPFQAAQSYVIIGQGLWGMVLDLTDGSVLKLIKQQAGIGDGLEKQQHEIAILQQLADHPLTPNVLGQDRLTNGALYKQGYRAWTHLTKMPGQTLSLSEAAQYPIDALADGIAEACYSIHQALTAVSGLKDVDYTDINAVSGPTVHQATQQLQRARQGRHQQPIHGDFNITNLRFEGTTVVGVLDFAETRLDVPEKDLSDIIKELPELQEALCAAYAALSGHTVVADALALGLAENALYTQVIEQQLT